MSGLIYPSHGIIARAIVTACRIANAAPDKLFEEHPEGVVTGEYGSRARHYAFGALVELFPDCPSHKVSVWVGFKSNNYGALSNHRTARKLKWWSDARLAEVIAALRAASPVCETAPKYSDPMPAATPSLSAKIAAKNPPLRKSPEIERQDSQKALEIMPEIMREAPAPAPKRGGYTHGKRRDSIISFASNVVTKVAAPVAEPRVLDRAAPRFVPPPIPPETLERIARAQEPETPNGAALEIVTTRVAAHDHAPRMADRDPLPAPRKAVRQVSVTGALLGDPGFSNPRERHGESSKDGGFE